MAVNKKKVGTIAVCSVLLVAMVMVVVMDVARRNKQEAEQRDVASLRAQKKAVQAVCEPTKFKETCEQSLSKASNTTDTRELVRAAFDSALQELTTVWNESQILQKAANDPRTSQAYQVCKKVLEQSIYDLQRSFDKFDDFDFNKVEEFIADLKSWLSGSMTHQVICKDAFGRTRGKVGEKINKILEKSYELTTNGLEMITEIQKLYEEYFPGSLLNRRLLSEKSSEEFPEWVEEGQRRLLEAGPDAVKADAVVAQDGSGQFKTIAEALKTVPERSNKTFVIHIKEGVYKESIEVSRLAWNVMFIGDGPSKTKITGSKSVLGSKVETLFTATATIWGDQFIAKNIGFENSAGAAAGQAVAAAVVSDRSVFFNCQFDGYQDTIFAAAYRQFYRDCTISGTIDFIFGNSEALFQKCNMIIRKPVFGQDCLVTAHGREQESQATAFVLQNCIISADKSFSGSKAFLGRPWKPYSRVIVMNSQIDSCIDPTGWQPWNPAAPSTDTCWYAEFGNTGPGSNEAGRAKWVKIIDASQAGEFTAAKFMQGDSWIPNAGVPYSPGMMGSS